MTKMDVIVHHMHQIELVCCGACSSDLSYSLFISEDVGRLQQGLTCGLLCNTRGILMVREDVRITSLVPSPLAQLPHVAYSTNSAFVAHIHLHNNAYI